MAPNFNIGFRFTPEKPYVKLCEPVNEIVRILEQQDTLIFA